MTTKAIEAGARADDLSRQIRRIIGGIYGLGDAPYAGGFQDKTIDLAVAKIAALVPASAVAAERERCIQAVRNAKSLDENGYITEKAAAIEAIRALEQGPASGEYVVVPRVPTEAMILAGHHQIDWGRDDQQTHVPEHPSQQHEGVGTTCKQDICDAWTAMLNAATKDGERA